MDREEYADFLGAANGYCGCHEIMDLLFARKKCQRLLELDKIAELKRHLVKYYAKLSVSVWKGVVVALLHEGHCFSQRRRILDSQIQAFNTPENVITLHCSKCGQQIDVMALERD